MTRVGIVGSGFGGAVHAPAFTLHPAFEVVAIASPRSAARVAAERRIPHHFSDVEAMLAGVELDLVAVASPPADHHRSVLAALAAGKPVLCEKPFARTLAEAEELEAARARAGVVGALNFEFRYGPGVRALRELVANGHLGPLREFETTMFAGTLRPEVERSRGWWFRRAEGGGMANAVAPHLLDLIRWVSGREIGAVRGMLRTAVPERRDAEGAFTSDVADGVFGLLDLGEGLVARLAIDATLRIEQTTAAVHGETRSAVATGGFLNDLALYVVDAEESAEYELAPTPHARFASVHPNVPLMLALLDELDRALRGEPNELPTFADGLAAQRVLDALGYGRDG